MKTLLLRIYRVRSGHRWRLRASNNRIIGASTEAYANKSDCYANINDVMGVQLKPRTDDFVRLRLRLGSRSAALFPWG
jgi:uncharacterized protein YegP (UPF0339 family)